MSLRKRNVASSAVTLLVTLALACCDREDARGELASGSPPAKPAPFTGTLTSDRVSAAKGMVRPLDRWDAALAILEGQLGKATRVHGDFYEWAVVDASSCTSFRVERAVESKYLQGGTEAWVVGVVLEPTVANESSTPADRRACREIAGAGAGPAEDPKAPGPPTNGESVPISTFSSAAVSGRSKWSGQRVRVRGVVVWIATITLEGAGATETHEVTLAPSATSRDPKVTCTMRSGAAEPSQSGDAEVVVEGRVVIRDRVNEAGDAVLEAALEECTFR
ncbi:MAG: hypothetical protein HOW73_45750 [Polyangiaceae bacterium]|nr:hypothetical protein [Polyangiaceae bacterium]